MITTVISMFKNKDIRNRILFTLLMLFIFRFGAAIVVPGVNTASLMAGVNSNSLLNMLNLLGGGMIQQLSIFSLGVGPYITASIILQLLSMDVIPYLTELAKSGASGKKVIDRYTRYLAVVLGFVQGLTMMIAFNQSYNIMPNATAADYLFVVTILSAGSMFLLWVGDQISMKGIGNGISILIFAGIVARMPSQFVQVFQELTKGNMDWSGIAMFGLYILVYLLIIIGVVLMQLAERKIPIQYTSSTVQTKKKDMTYLPLKLNSASVIPVIFASSVMIAPATIASFFTQNSFTKALTNFTDMTKPVGLLIYVILTILFTFFYTKLMVDPEKVSENLNKSGTYIPGIRPGTETKEYLNQVLNRLTVLGSLALAFIAAIPYLMPMITNLPKSMGLGGTGIIIVVGVAMETWKSLKGQLTQRSYRGFISKS